MVEVVAARIWQNDTFLICQRAKEKAQGMLWEFVGGKVEPSETKPEALIRECQEELNITLDVGKEVIDITPTSPSITIHLTLFDCHIAKGVPTKLEHNAICWIKEEEISNYPFCPADEDMIHLLQNKEAH